MGMFGEPIEKSLQLYFRDDGRFIFRFLELLETIMVERNKEKAIIRGWKHIFGNQFPFVGYKNIPSGKVTLGFNRDVILDPYKLVPDSEKPDKGAVDTKGLVRIKSIVKWLTDIGEARRLKLMAKRGKNSSYDRIIMFLGIGFMLEIVIICIVLLQNRVAGG
jgi:hypothetical protein